MAILGKIIKTIVHSSKVWSTQTRNAGEQQKDTLKQLMFRAKDTAFGRHYGFGELLKAHQDPRQVFAQQLPVYDYQKIHQVWWHRCLAGEDNICWPGKTRYFALSAGTTEGRSKQIPVSEAMLKAIRRSSLRMIMHLRNYQLPASLFEKSIFMLSGATSLQKQDGHFQGEISGISAANVPTWSSFYSPA
ncbi:MAG: GH3 auxin-responsive promoter family protein, partial [Bacteroidia bacterium]|nr:GH3 auxin-responsive promoter family protein [Bacteroidia bacterium]